MFNLYGISGPIFYEPAENLTRIRGIDGIRSARRLASSRHSSDVDEVSPAVSPAGEEAQRGYRAMLPSEIERGPLLRADQIMERQVIHIDQNDDVAHAWRTLRDNRIHQAPVLGANASLVGIVSERDLLTAINIDDGKVIEALNRRVSDVMTTPVVAADVATDIRHIATMMLEQGVDGVPIVSDSGRLVGFISRGDILRSVTAQPPLSLWR